uniref:Hypothetical secreted protein n=1 Tax=Simulium nigrimanum TaxID=683695 RepID=D1FPX5_SIMNI
MKSCLVVLTFVSALALANGYLSDLSAAERMAETIYEVSQKDRKNGVRNSKFLSPGMDKLNKELINPYNVTSNHVGLEETLAKGLKQEPATCDAARTLSYSIQERSDYFYNQLNGNRPSDHILCPINIPTMQREHELVMGYLLNRLRMHVLRSKKCEDSVETKEKVAKALKRLAENRFANEGEAIKSCKQSNEDIKSTCINTGVLKAGPNEVITGLRLRKITNSIILEMQVAKVTVFGLIDKSTQKWVGPGSAAKTCLPIKNLIAAKPVRLPQGNVLTQVQLVGKAKNGLLVAGQKLDFYTGKLTKGAKGQVKDVFKLNGAVSINTEPVYVSTTVAGAGLKYDEERKTISPVLIAQNMAVYKA